LTHSATCWRPSSCGAMKVTLDEITANDLRAAHGAALG